MVEIVDRQALLDDAEWRALRIEAPDVEHWYESFNELMQGAYYSICDRMWASGSYEVIPTMPELAHPNPAVDHLTLTRGGVALMMGGSLHPDIVLDALVEGLESIGLGRARISQDLSTDFGELRNSWNESEHVFGWFAPPTPDPSIPREFPDKWCDA